MPMELLVALTRRGIKLWVEGDHLRFRASQEMLRAEDLAALHDHEVQLRDLVRTSTRPISLPLVPREPGEQIPLTAMQRRFRNVVIQQGNRSFRECVLAVRISGALDTGRLQHCIEAVVRGHEALRTRIAASESGPAQEVDERCGTVFEVVKIPQAAHLDIDALARQEIRNFLLEAVDLSAGPLFVSRLFQGAPDAAILVLAFDHMICDAASMALCNKELWTLYRANDEERPGELQRPRLQFADYSLWQRRISEQWLRLHGEYWRCYLRDAPEVHVRRDANVRSNDASVATCRFLLDGAGGVRLGSIARREGMLLSVVALAIYVAAVSEWLNQQELTLTFVWDARTRPELATMVGFIATALYLRIDIPRGCSVLELLRIANRQLCAAMERQDYDRVPDLAPECVTDLQFNWIQSAAPTSHPGVQRTSNTSLKVEPWGIERIRPIKFAPHFYDTGRGIVVSISYGRNHFMAATMDRFRTILQRHAAALN